MILEYEMRVLRMLWYPIIHSLAVSFIQWCTKSISYSNNMTKLSYIQRPMYMTPDTLKLKKGRNLILDHELRVLGILWYPIINSLAVSITEWCTKSISQSTDMTQPYYIKRPMYMTQDTLKRKPR